MKSVTPVSSVTDLGAQLSFIQIDMNFWLIRDRDESSFIRGPMKLTLPNVPLRESFQCYATASFQFSPRPVSDESYVYAVLMQISREILT
jgi:hypothetical protein